MGLMAATLWVSGCGHFNCTRTFGASTCNSGGGSTKTGGGTSNNFTVFGYSVAITGPNRGMAFQKLDTSASNQFVNVGSFLPPVFPAFPTGVVIVNKTMLYIPSSDGTLFAYTIDPATGNLTAVGTPYTVVGGDSIAASASGNLLFVGDTAGQRISVFAVNSDATLTAVTGSPFPTLGVSPQIMTTDGKTKFLYATEGTGSGLMAGFSIASNGALTSIIGSPFASSMVAIAGEASGSFLFGVTRITGDNHIYAFQINNSTGVLTQVVNPVQTTGTPYNISVHPSGSWVYALNRDRVLGTIEPVEGFAVDPTSGALTQLGGSPFAGLLADGGPIDPGGDFLFGLGVLPNGISAVTPYTIDQTTGALTSTINSEGFIGVDAAAYAVTDVK
jgi:6-phosphogluconolactonase (cycloisomerase 2 family)